MDNKRKSTSKEPPRSRSVLPSLTHFDAMQNVYSDVKGLDRKIQYVDDPHVISHSLRGRTGGFSGWHTGGPGDRDDVTDSLPNVHSTLVAPQSEKGQRRRSKSKEKFPVDNGSRGVAGGTHTHTQTPTISIQVFDFAEDSPAMTKVKKTKNKRPVASEQKGERGRDNSQHGASTHPAKDGSHLGRHPMSSAGTQGSGILGWG